HLVGAVTLEQPTEASGADLRRGVLREQVAPDPLGHAHVDLDQLLQRRVEPAARVELERRDADAFLVDFGRIARVRSRHPAADVGVMTDHHGERPALAAVEDRHEHEDVGEGRAGVIGVVHDHGVALVEIVAELGEHGGDGFRYGAEVKRDGLGLRHHLSLGVTERRREIHHVLDDLRARDAHDGVGHVVDDGIEPALDYRERNGVDLHVLPPISTTMLPIASRETIASGGTTMVASNSSMISGPGRAPRSTDWRVTIGVSVKSWPRWKDTARRPAPSTAGRSVTRMAAKSRRRARRPRPISRILTSSIAVSS